MDNSPYISVPAGCVFAGRANQSGFANTSRDTGVGGRILEPFCFPQEVHYAIEAVRPLEDWIVGVVLFFCFKCG